MWCDNGEQRERVRHVLSTEAKHKYFCAFDVFSGPPRCIPEVETHAIDREDVARLYQKIVVQAGAEGLVVRDSQGGIWKIKPAHTIDACILGFAEGNPGEVRDVLLGVCRDAVNVQRLCSCGTGFDRRALFQQLLPLVTASDYTETNSDHTPYRMVANVVAVELEFTDLCTDNAAGESVRRPVLEFDGGRWKQVARKPGVSVIFPRILRIRDDKYGIHCHMSQITDLVDVQGADEPVQIDPEHRQTLARAVFTKTIKGAVAVRKLVLLRMATKPEYIIHYTDFSEVRKVPLERDLWASNDKDQSWEKFKTWTIEVISTRGWTVQHAEGFAEVAK